MFVNVCDETPSKPEIDQIEQGLYLGNEHASRTIEELKARKITHILCAGMELKTHFPKAFKYLHLKVRDDYDEDLYQHFESACQFISDAFNAGQGQANVFIHCAQGVSRSSSLTIAYLMQKYRKDFKTVHDYVLSKRSVIKPNAGFRKQL